MKSDLPKVLFEVCGRPMISYVIDALERAGVERIVVVVNRHLRRSTVGLDDIRRTLAREKLAIVPNQYLTVLSSIDGGVPVLELDASSAVAKAIVNLQRELCGEPPTERTSLLRRALPMFSGD